MRLSNNMAVNGTGKVRPMERTCMRDWMMEHLDRKSFPGFEWLDRKEHVFRVKWFHGSRAGWNYNDCRVFEAWAVHTGYILYMKVYKDTYRSNDQWRI